MGSLCLTTIFISQHAEKLKDVRLRKANCEIIINVVTHLEIREKSFGNQGKSIGNE